MKPLFLSSALVLASASQANAWSYNCPAQSVSGHSFDYVSISDQEVAGGTVTMRYSVDGTPGTVPVLNSNGPNDFRSPDKNDEVVIGTDMESDGTYTIDVKIKSLSINAYLGCN
jgi:hypothetical protein